MNHACCLELYLNGLQRRSFIPCIELIKSSFEIINLSSEIDHRTAKIFKSGNGKRRFFNNLNDLNDLFTEMCPDGEAFELELDILFSRRIKIPIGQEGNCSKFHFKELFEESKSAADYIEISKHFPKIFITNVPKIKRERIRKE